MLLKTNGLNFNNLSTEGYTTFVLAILFTIITLASMIYYVRRKEVSNVGAILITLVFPALTVFCWMYLILLVKEFTTGNALLWAFIAAMAYLAVATLIATAVAFTAKDKKEAPVVEEAKEEEKKADEVLLIEAPAEEAAEEVTEEPAEEPAEEVAEEPVEEPVEEQAAEEQAAEETTEEVAEEQPVEETTEEVEEEAEEPTVEGVIFTKASKETFAEQLAKLSEEQLALYNEILEYAQAKEGTKTSQSRSHLMVKVGRLRLIEMKFLREKLVCKFMVGSSEIKNYSLAEKSVKIKEKPVNIELDGENSLAVAKNMVDIVYKNIVEAKEDKKANEVVAPVESEDEEE